MKKIIFFCLILNVISARGQTVVVNDKLIAQLTKNQAVRLTSNEGFLKSYEKQKQLYDDINKKITQVVAIQEFIYDKLSKVNQTIKQGKQLKYLYKYLGEVGEHSGKMLKLTAKYPQYAIKEEILREDSDLLIDPYDREVLISRIFDRVRILHANVMYINLMLERGKDTPYIYQIPHLGWYVNMDKSIVEDIMRKYQYLKY